MAEQNGQLVLDLPRELRSQLAAKAPQFHMFSQCDFLPSIVAALPRLRREGVEFLSAVVGDFDGDRLSDVILTGHVADRKKLILIFTRAEDYEFRTYDRGFFNPHGWYAIEENAYEYGLDWYLRKVRPGKITSPYEKQTLGLKTDAFEIVFIERASVVYYWKDGELKRYITSD